MSLNLPEKVRRQLGKGALLLALVAGSSLHAATPTNVALGKTATASSIENATFPASSAVDASATTRWASVFGDPQWLAVDLGGSYQLNQVVLVWEAAFAQSYKIQASQDNTTWTDAYTTTSGAGGTETLSIATTARYVRMYGTQRATAYGYSLFDFQVYGVPAVNTAPTITTIADQTINQDTSSAAIAFTLGDAETPAANLSLVATTDNPTLIPLANIVFGGSGTSRTVKLTPAAHLYGTAKVRVRVNDSMGGTNSSLFSVTVKAGNTLPTITTIADQTIPANGSSTAIPFTIGDAETPAASLSLVATTDTPTLILVSNIVFGGSGANRTVKITPVAGQSGTAKVRVRVTDAGGLSNSTLFNVTVNAANANPVISTIGNQSIPLNTSSAAIPFTISDQETPAANLSLVGTCSTTLIPISGIVFAGSGNNRTVTLTPLADRTGTCNVRVRVNDPKGGTNSTLFSVTVTAEAPSLSVAPTTLTLPATACTTTVGVTSNVAWTASSSDGWLTGSPASGTGNATLTLNASANPTTASRSATVTLSGGGKSAVIAVTQSSKGGWTLLWNDEFDTPGALDTSKWRFETGLDWFNGELQAYTSDPKNARVEGGHLVVEAISEVYQTKNFTSARVNSVPGWTYGRMEIKALLPIGTKLWPAIWMLPDTNAYGGWPNSGEIDIMEQWSISPTVVFGTVHTEAYNHTIGTQKGSNLVVSDPAANWHVYAIEWYQDQLRMFVDDVNYFTFYNEGTHATWPFDQSFHFLFNIAVESGAISSDPTWTKPTMEIDYVRVYSGPITAPVPPPQPLPGRVEAEDWTKMSGVATEACSEGTKDVGWIDAGDWMDYQVNVATAGTYTIRFRVATTTANAGFNCLVDGAQALNVSFPSSGDWQAWTTVERTITLPAGVHTLRISAIGGFNINWFEAANG